MGKPQSDSRRVGDRSSRLVDQAVHVAGVLLPFPYHAFSRISSALGDRAAWRNLCDPC